jgi:hypothetical protein
VTWLGCLFNNGRFGPFIYLTCCRHFQDRCRCYCDTISRPERNNLPGYFELHDFYNSFEISHPQITWGCLLQSVAPLIAASTRSDRLARRCCHSRGSSSVLLEALGVEHQRGNPLHRTQLLGLRILQVVRIPLYLRHAVPDTYPSRDQCGGFNG